jgi:hypothetical protein
MLRIFTALPVAYRRQEFLDGEDLPPLTGLGTVGIRQFPGLAPPG